MFMFIEQRERERWGLSAKHEKNVPSIITSWQFTCIHFPLILFQKYYIFSALFSLRPFPRHRTAWHPSICLHFHCMCRLLSNHTKGSIISPIVFVRWHTYRTDYVRHTQTHTLCRRPCAVRALCRVPNKYLPIFWSTHEVFVRDPNNYCGSVPSPRFVVSRTICRKSWKMRKTGNVHVHNIIDSMCTA